MAKQVWMTDDGNVFYDIESAEAHEKQDKTERDIVDYVYDNTRGIDKYDVRTVVQLIFGQYLVTPK